MSSSCHKIKISFRAQYCIGTNLSWMREQILPPSDVPVPVKIPLKNIFMNALRNRNVTSLGGIWVYFLVFHFGFNAQQNSSGKRSLLGKHLLMIFLKPEHLLKLG